MNVSLRQISLIRTLLRPRIAVPICGKNAKTLPQINFANHHIRSMASSPNPKPIYDTSLLDSGDRKIIKARELLGVKKLPLYILKKSSVFLYESCTDRVDIEKFIKHLNLEDTFSTWFAVTRLHVWMVMVRCMKEGKPTGETLRNELVARMWEDTTARLGKLGHIKTKLKRSALTNYYDEFNATILALDEGLLGDDMTLAGALWRTLLYTKSNDDPDAVRLESMVCYVRAQIDHLDRYCKSQDVVLRGSITWKPISPLITT